MKIERFIYAFIIISVVLTNILINTNKVETYEITLPAVAANFDENYVYNEELVIGNIIDEMVKPVVYENMTVTELGEKLEKSLNSTLKGYGQLFASYATEKGVDPYLAVAISLHETGCAWDCSKLVKKCNNVGGQKGDPSCDGGAYRTFETLEDGIKGYIDNLYNGYISKGLITPDAMQRKYTGGSTTWANKVSNYIEKIKAN